MYLITNLNINNESNLNIYDKIFIKNIFNLNNIENKKYKIENNFNIFYDLKEYNPFEDIKIKFFSELNLNKSYYENNFNNKLSLSFIKIDFDKFKTSFLPFISIESNPKKLSFMMNLNKRLYNNNLSNLLDLQNILNF